MGRAAQSWEVLAGLVVVMVMLGCGWSDGQVLTKCDLRSRLQKAFLRHPSDVIAKMVCTVEYISFFNTSLVTANNHPHHGSLIRPLYFGGHQYPHHEVIGDYFPETWPEEVEPENPPLPPEVVDDGLIPARSTDQPAITSVQDDNQPGSDVEAPSGKGSEEASESHTQDKRGVHSEEESGEDVSGQDMSGEWSGNGIKGSLDKPHITGPLVDVGPESGSGEPIEPITAIPQWDSTDHDFYHLFDNEPYEGSTDTTSPPLGDNNEEVHYDTYESLFGHKPTEGPTDTTIPPLGDNNEEVHYDTYESLFGHKPTEGPTDTTIPPLGDNNEEVYYDTYESLFGHELTEGSTDMPNDSGYPTTTTPPLTNTDQEIHYDSYESLYGHGPRRGLQYMPFFNGGYGPMNPDNGPFYGYDQDSSSTFLYGIFQLSDDMACQSQWKHSWNVCNLNCEDLIDSDITDDIACLMVLKQKGGMDVMVLEQCQTVDASEYFAECD